MPLRTPAGYCHNLIRYSLPQGWSATISGEFTMEAEYDDEENIIYPITFYCGEKYIRFLYAFADGGTEVFEPKQIWRTQWDHKYLCLDTFTYKAGEGHGQQWNCRVQASGHSLAVELEGKAGAWNVWVMEVFDSIVYMGKADSERGTFA